MRDRRIVECYFCPGLLPTLRSAGQNASERPSEFGRHHTVQHRIYCTEMMRELLTYLGYYIYILPVDVDAGLGEHEEPEVHVPLTAGEDGQGVVDQHPAVWQPQRGKDGDDGYQHLHNLQQRVSSHSDLTSNFYCSCNSISLYCPTKV